MGGLGLAGVVGATMEGLDHIRTYHGGAQETLAGDF